jgi:uncharacterized membrane protein HdeD (DUF308 family)
MTTFTVFARSRGVFAFVSLLAKGEESRLWPPLQGIVSMLVGVVAVLAIAGVILSIRWLLRLD